MVLVASQMRDTIRRYIVKIEYLDHENIKKHTRCTLHHAFLPEQSDIDELSDYERMIVAWDINEEKWVVIDLELIINFEPEV